MHNLTAGAQTLATKLAETLSCSICSVPTPRPHVYVQSTISLRRALTNYCCSVQCGHAFCAGCLENWFSRQLQEHVRRHPGPAVDVLPYEQALRNPFINGEAHARLRSQIARLRQAQPPPCKYTCPTCRHSLTVPPAKDFLLSEVVNCIAEATGERLPNEPATYMTARRWDRFFPRT